MTTTFGDGYIAREGSGSLFQTYGVKGGAADPGNADRLVALGADGKVDSNLLPAVSGGALLILNNLSDLNNVVTARSNLGLGGSALAPAGTYLERLSNLSDLTNAATARDNIGLGDGDIVSTAGVMRVTFRSGTGNVFVTKAEPVLSNPTFNLVASVVPAAISDMMIALTDNTHLTIAVKGSDSVVRSAVIVLAP